MESTPPTLSPLARHPRLVDAVVAGGLALLALLGAARSGFIGDTSRWVIAGLAVVQVAPLWWRRTRPEASFAVVVLGHLAQLLVTDEALPSNVAAPFAAFAIAAYSPRVRWRLAGLVTALSSGPLSVVDWWTDEIPTSPQIVSGVFFSAVATLSWAWGDLSRRRRGLLQRLHEQNLALRRDRDQRARLAAQDERTRIAREMHDVVAHSLAVVVVQADGAAYTAEHAPNWQREHATQTLQTIATTAREALDETRRLVGVLRSDSTTVDDAGHDGYAPAGSAADLETVVERVRDSGVSVDTELDDLDGLPRDLELATLRIVQESLTNVLKHAGPQARATVRVRRRDGVDILVEDDGLGGNAGHDGHGHGVLGMTERAAALGGTLHAGPRSGGGWRVAARLPERHPQPGTPRDPGRMPA